MTDRSHRSIHSQWGRTIAHLLGGVPLILLGWQLVQGRLGFNPVESVLRWTGRLALGLLLLSLSVTPIRKIFKISAISAMRKPLGLYAALYAFIHFSVFALWDYQLNIRQIYLAISNKPFILLGMIALLILLVLAATSFRFWQRKLGRKWVWLHRSVYAAALLVILHYLLAVKGDLFSLQGAYTAPLIAAGILLLLLILRIPAIQQCLRPTFTQQEPDQPASD